MHYSFGVIWQVMERYVVCSVEYFMEEPETAMYVIGLPYSSSMPVRGKYALVLFCSNYWMKSWGNRWTFHCRSSRSTNATTNNNDDDDENGLILVILSRYKNVVQMVMPASGIYRFIQIWSKLYILRTLEKQFSPLFLNKYVVLKLYCWVLFR